MKKQSLIGVLGVIAGILVGLEFGYKYFNMQSILESSSGFAQIAAQMVVNAMKTTVILGIISALCCFIAAVSKIPWFYLISALLLIIAVFETPQIAATSSYITECIVFLVLMLLSFVVDKKLIEKEKGDKSG